MGRQKKRNPWFSFLKLWVSNPQLLCLKRKE
jgi:hypothetical protein